MPYYIYILHCSNHSYYIGYTTDMQRRYKEHQEGSAKCKYTRSFPPLAIAACWQVDADLSTVLKIECLLKRLSKSRKQALVARPADLSQLTNDLVSYAALTFLNA